jgi:ubiquitin carboxyl-terminal hydrolase L3
MKTKKWCGLDKPSTMHAGSMQYCIVLATSLIRMVGQKSIRNSRLQLTPIIEADSFLGRLMATEDRTEYLENSEYLDAVYQQAATSGSSEAPPAEAEIEHHYVCFVKRSCFLYELDGDREGPMRRNVLEQDEDVLSKKGREVIQMYTQSDLEGSFSLLALIDSS